ncbi:unnamed protein product [Effrenium voratum]|nr:unnamed protein product [Effrenium voratum]
MAGTVPVLPYLALYVASGAAQPLLMWELHKAGLGDPRCQLYMVPYYVGMAATGLLFLARAESLGSAAAGWRRCAATALLGIAAQSLNWAGSMRAGSSIFAVVYASVTIWSALLSRLLLQRRLVQSQWLGIALVVAGLALTGCGARQLGPEVLSGTAMVAAGTILHAACHVVSEYISVRGARIQPHLNASLQGLTGCAVVGTWQLTFTASHWQRIAVPVEEAGTSWPRCIALLAGLALSNFVHAGTFFQLLTQVGVVSTGVAKALQGVLVFVLSHLLYCRQDESQCFSSLKGVSLLVVTWGVLTYIAASKPSKH